MILTLPSNETIVLDATSRRRNGDTLTTFDRFAKLAGVRAAITDPFGGCDQHTFAVVERFQTPLVSSSIGAVLSLPETDACFGGTFVEGGW